MPDVKIFDPFVRKPGTSVAEFSHYWITKHAELVKQFRPIKRYVQNMRLDHKPAGLGKPLGETWCDGCAQTWYDDVSAVDSMVDQPLFPLLMEDETRFLDFAHPRYLLKTHERILDVDGFDERLRGVKVMLFVRRAPGLERSDFETAWADDATADLGRRLGVTRHVVCAAIGDDAAIRHPNVDGPRVPAAGGTDGYDGVRELWWPDMATLEAALESQPRTAADLLWPDAIDAGRSFALVAHERIIVR